MPYRKDLHYNSSRKPWWWLNIHLDGFVEFENLMGHHLSVWFGGPSPAASWVFCLFRFALLAIHSWSSFGYCYICLIDLMLILILFFLLLVGRDTICIKLACYSKHLRSSNSVWVSTTCPVGLSWLGISDMPLNREFAYPTEKSAS